VIWYGEAGFKAVPAGPYEFDAVGPRAIENFLDVAHLGIVHDGLLGASERPTIEQYEVEKTEDGLFAPAVKLYQPDFQSVGSGQYVYYDYHIFRPLTVQLKSSNMGQPGPGFSVWLSVCPVNRNHCVGWMWLIHNFEGVPDEVFIEREDLILSQDIGIVNTQHPELLPLDLREELHLMSDRTAIEYRKWIRELGLSYGTA
jgi:phenylpropionate dioxygenase-like ring-hydroxylating dioxygenase large terminal subunit